MMKHRCNEQIDLISMIYKCLSVKVKRTKCTKAWSQNGSIWLAYCALMRTDWGVIGSALYLLNLPRADSRRTPDTYHERLLSPILRHYLPKTERQEPANGTDGVGLGWSITGLGHFTGKTTIYQLHAGVLTAHDTSWSFKIPHSIQVKCKAS